MCDGGDVEGWHWRLEIGIGIVGCGLARIDDLFLFLVCCLLFLRV